MKDLRVSKLTSTYMCAMLVVCEVCDGDEWMEEEKGSHNCRQILSHLSAFGILLNPTFSWDALRFYKPKMGCFKVEAPQMRSSQRW